MSDDKWRPLGIDADDDVASYDALHEDVPGWMEAAYWAWVRDRITEYRRYADGSGRIPHLDEEFAEQMAQELRIPFPNLRVTHTNAVEGRKQLHAAMALLRGHQKPLQVADYLLAHSANIRTDELEALLTRSNSAWRVGSRLGRPGLVRRVPLGVQTGAEIVMNRSGRAGVRLARAWESLYGLSPNPSEAYRQAILAVEDAAVPVVSRNNASATLGSVLSQMENQGDWRLPMVREHPKALSNDVLLGMMRVLWHGQHDRHGGQPSAPGNVSAEEGVVAVGIATALVHWFEAGIVARRAS